jgi:hypothetical protein
MIIDYSQNAQINFPQKAVQSLTLWDWGAVLPQEKK